MKPFIVGHATHPEWTGAFAIVAAQLDAQLQAADGRADAGDDGQAGGQARGQADGQADAAAQHAKPGMGADARPEDSAARRATERGAPTLGLVYITDAYAAAAEPLLAALRQRWPRVAFVGTVGVGVCASGVEYFDEPAMVVMLASLPRDQFQVFSGAAGLPGVRRSSPGFSTALVHADPHTPDLPDLLAELGARTETGYLFGGVTASRQRHVQFADGVFQGGLSGVAFGTRVPVISRVTQGCTPLGPARRVTASDGAVVLTLDGQPALAQLLADLQITTRGGTGGPVPTRTLREAVPRLRRTLVGLTEPESANGQPEGTTAGVRRGNFGEEVRVRHLIGVDPARQGFAVAEGVHPGMRLSFCERDATAARRDLVRMCTEIRDELENRAEALHPVTHAASGVVGAGGVPEAPRGPGVLGAVYVSCSGRGGPHFGGPSAELQLVRHALGDVPLVGFFAAGEIARQQLYGYTGVLTVFCS